MVSLDYIKADKRRDGFARACPDFVIVDEAHACVGTHQGRQQRFELLQALAEDAERHLLLLTATPHSGDEEAFARLLALARSGVRRRRASTTSGTAQRLARHFVQRRRIDITSRDWGEERAFPKHETTETPYRARRRPQRLPRGCARLLPRRRRERRDRPARAPARLLGHAGADALRRLVAGGRALSALRNRLATDPDRLETQVFDDDGDDEDAVDVEPAAVDRRGCPPAGAGRRRPSGLAQSARPEARGASSKF